MAGTPPAAKRFHLSNSSAEISKIVADAQAINFPWASALPVKIQSWFEAFGKSHNTAPEYVFIGALVTTAAIMGPKWDLSLS